MWLEVSCPVLAEVERENTRVAFDYVPILIQILVAFAIAIGVIVIANFVGSVQRLRNLHRTSVG